MTNIADTEQDEMLARTTQSGHEYTIDVFYSEMNEGWNYDLYEGHGNIEHIDEFDGGLCTTTKANAIEMAKEQAEKYFTNK